MRFKDSCRLAAGLIALFCIAQGAAAAEGADEAAIRAQTTEWAEAYNAGDAARVVALYAEEAVLLPPGAPAARGRDAILDFFNEDIKAARTAGIVMNPDPDTDVGISGDIGWESGTYTATVGDAIVDTGKFLSVSVKRNGKWLYLRDTWNSDMPPAPPASLEEVD